MLPGELGPGVVADLAEGVNQIAQSRVKTELSRAEVNRWHDALTPVIAPQPPPGVTVERPYSRGRFLVTMFGVALLVTLLIVAVVTAIVLATS